MANMMNLVFDYGNNDDFSTFLAHTYLLEIKSICYQKVKIVMSINAEHDYSEILEALIWLWRWEYEAIWER